MEISKGGNLRASQVRAMDQENEMNSTLMALDREIEKLTEECREGLKKIEKKKFFKEWTLMTTEHEGAQSLNGRLKL